MLRRLKVPALMVVSAVPQAGKTATAGAIAFAAREQGCRVGAIEAIDRHAVRRREGLVSEDAELLAHRGDVRFPLDLICPLRYRGGSVSALGGGVADWDKLQRSIDLMQGNVDLLVIDSAGGLLTPLDARHTTLDLARVLGPAAVVVVRPGEDALNQMLLVLHALRSSGVPPAGVVLNGYSPEKASATDERLLSALEQWGKTPLLAVFPEEPSREIVLGPGISDAALKVDWLRAARGR